MSGVRHSEHSGRGNGGRLIQMRNLKRMQTERSKQPSAVDIATQGEEVNPMAPSSQDSGRSTSCKGQAPSNGAAIGSPLAHPQPAPSPPSLRLVFKSPVRSGFLAPKQRNRTKTGPRNFPRPGNQQLDRKKPVLNDPYISCNRLQPVF